MNRIGYQKRGEISGNRWRLEIGGASVPRGDRVLVDTSHTTTWCHSSRATACLQMHDRVATDPSLNVSTHSTIFCSKQRRERCSRAARQTCLSLFVVSLSQIFCRRAEKILFRGVSSSGLACWPSGSSRNAGRHARGKMCLESHHQDVGGVVSRI